MRRLRPLLAALLLSLPPSAALGEPAPPAPPPGDWRVSAGMGVVTSPKYPGAESTRTIPVPWWDVSWRNRFFSRGLDFAGVYLANDGKWSAGAALRYDFAGREAKDDPRLAGTDDVDGTVLARAFLTRKVSLLSLSLGASQDVGGNGHGLLATADVSVAVPFFPGWFFSAGPGISWGDRRRAETFFGVTPEAAARSGLPAYRASSGILDAHLSLVARRAITDRWGAAANVTLARLTGSASDSPVTESREQATAIVSVSYRFAGEARGGNANGR